MNRPFGSKNDYFCLITVLIIIYGLTVDASARYASSDNIKWITMLK